MLVLWGNVTRKGEGRARAGQLGFRVDSSEHSSPTLALKLGFSVRSPQVTGNVLSVCLQPIRGCRAACHSFSSTLPHSSLLPTHAGCLHMFSLTSVSLATLWCTASLYKRSKKRIHITKRWNREVETMRGKYTFEAAAWTEVFKQSHSLPSSFATWFDSANYSLVLTQKEKKRTLSLVGTQLALVGIGDSIKNHFFHWPFTSGPTLTWFQGWLFLPRVSVAASMWLKILKPLCSRALGGRHIVEGESGENWGHICR